MKPEVIISKYNEVFARIHTDPAILYELAEHMTFEVPNARFQPRVQSGAWDGKIRLINALNSTIHGGLVPKLAVLVADLGYKPIVDPSYKPVPVDANEIRRKIASFNLPSRIEVEEFQYAAVEQILSRRRALIISPTSSGKSLIMYLAHRFLGGRTLVVVPLIKLVGQLEKEFKGFGFTGTTHGIAEGTTSDSDADVVFATWHSIYKKPAKWFAQFDNVFADEVHRFEASSTRTLMEKTTTIANRIGLTGTLKGAKTHELALTGLFGTVYVATTTRELIDMGFTSDVEVVVLVFKYPSDIQDQLPRMHSYADEKKLLLGCHLRNKYIRNLVASLDDGNTLVMFRQIDKHGVLLKEQLDTIGRTVHFVHGRRDAKKARDALSDALEAATNDIGLTSSGTTSTGISINNIQYLILGDAIKARVDLLQTLGRGLRKDGKSNYLKMFDLADKLARKGDKTNPYGYSYRHLQERLQIYSEVQIPYKIIEIQL